MRHLPNPNAISHSAKIDRILTHTHLQTHTLTLVFTVFSICKNISYMPTQTHTNLLMYRDIKKIYESSDTLTNQLVYRFTILVEIIFSKTKLV